MLQRADRDGHSGCRTVTVLIFAGHSVVRSRLCLGWRTTDHTRISIQ